MNLQQPFRRILTILMLSISITACASGTDRPVLNDSKLEKLAHIHYQLGIDALGKQGMLPKAFNELMESNTILPNQSHVLDALAYAWLLRGDLKKSESFYRQALHYGDNASIHNNYANLLNRLKRFDEAEKSARKALNDPRYVNQDFAFINLGNALLGQKKFPEAIQAFQQAKLFNANNTIADLRLAETYYQQDRLREARLLYNNIIHQQPDNRSAIEGLLAVLNKQHDESQSHALLQQFSEHTSSAMDKAWARDRMDQIDRMNQTDRLDRSNPSNQSDRFGKSGQSNPGNEQDRP